MSSASPTHSTHKAKNHHPLIVLGAGTAGYTAALYAARAELSPTLITAREPGGQLVLTDHIHNWPGEAASPAGDDLMRRMHDQSARFGANIVCDYITQVDLGQRPFVLTGNQERYSCDTLIIATGESPSLPSLPSARDYLRKGVMPGSYQQGPSFRGKHVVIVGGGNIAATEALYLAEHAERISMVHRRDRLRAEKAMTRELQALAEADRIHMYWNHVLDEVLGNDEHATGARIRHVQTGESRDLAADEIILATGLKPNTDLFAGQLAMTNGYIQVQRGAEMGFTATSMPGVFAAGDVMDSVYRQAITAAGSGCMAALDAENYLNQQATTRCHGVTADTVVA